MRRASTTEEALRARARRLPPGEVKRVLMASTLYEVLRLPPPPSNECGVADVKRAYKKLALKLRPDRCKEELAEEAFKRLEEAHRTLTTPTLRRDYNEQMAWWM